MKPEDCKPIELDTWIGPCPEYLVAQRKRIVVMMLLGAALNLLGLLIVEPEKVPKPHEFVLIGIACAIIYAAVLWYFQWRSRYWGIFLGPEACMVSWAGHVWFCYHSAARPLKLGLNKRRTWWFIEGANSREQSAKTKKRWLRRAAWPRLDECLKDCGANVDIGDTAV